MTYSNSHNKWHHIVGCAYFALTDPSDIPKGGDVLPCTPNPFAVLVLRGQTLSDCQHMTCVFEAVKTGVVNCFFENHCAVTDINGDGKVDIMDIAMIAQKYGTHVHWQHENYSRDVDCDTWIDMDDVIFTVAEYGRQFPQLNSFFCLPQL